MTTIKKFTNNTKVDMVKKEDLIEDGDWILKWNPSKSTPTDSGYELLTPGSFDENGGQAQMGGVILAAVFFLIENDTDDFFRALIDRANLISKQQNEPPERKDLH